MLVLTRRAHEKILIPAIKTSVQILNIRSNAVRLGIDAPPEIAIVRDEIADANLATEGSLGRQEALIHTRGELLRGRDELLRGREELLRGREESLKGRQEMFKRQRWLFRKILHQNKLRMQVALARLDLSLLSGEVQEGMDRRDLLRTLDRIEQGLRRCTMSSCTLSCNRKIVGRALRVWCHGEPIDYGGRFHARQFSEAFYSLTCKCIDFWGNKIKSRLVDWRNVKIFFSGKTDFCRQ